MATLIHLFKYKKHSYLDDFFCGLMVSHLHTLGIDLSHYCMITSVPMHPSKYKARGYNQAHLLGKKLANYFKIPFRDDIIYGIKNKPSQVSLQGKEREMNVKDAFMVKDTLEGKKIVLVDDIFTTGATLQQCSSLLRKNGASQIFAITVSKTLADADQTQTRSSCLSKSAKEK
ncbi:MAG: ComF family protein [Candidatus Omnitrophota bacterium]|nr:MAG: ComF family protein [Candidatus Omnitrophota bacterium]